MRFPAEKKPDSWLVLLALQGAAAAQGTLLQIFLLSTFIFFLSTWQLEGATFKFPIMNQMRRHISGSNLCLMARPGMLPTCDHWRLCPAPASSPAPAAESGGSWTNHRGVLWSVDQSEVSIAASWPIRNQYSALPGEAAGAAAGAGHPRHLGGAGAQPRAAPWHDQWWVFGFLNFDFDICAFTLL